MELKELQEQLISYIENNKYTTDVRVMMIVDRASQFLEFIELWGGI